MSEFAHMALCLLAVGLGVVPMGLIAARIARRSNLPLLPRWRLWSGPWTGLEVILGLVVIHQVVPLVVVNLLLSSGNLNGLDLDRSASISDRDHELNLPAPILMLWASVLSLPLQICLFLVGRNRLHPEWRSPQRLPLANLIFIACAAWVALTVVVLGIHLGVIAVFATLGWVPDEHSLRTIMVGRPRAEYLLLILQACVAAPLVEEMIFRGMILPWARSRRHGPWIVIAASLGMAALLGFQSELRLANLYRGPILFAVLLAVGWGLNAIRQRRAKRTLGAVYATAALFATVHSGVWPSPIPLFVLGAGAGLPGGADAWFSCPGDRPRPLQCGLDPVRLDQLNAQAARLTVSLTVVSRPRTRR